MGLFKSNPDRLEKYHQRRRWARRLTWVLYGLFFTCLLAGAGIQGLVYAIETEPLGRGGGLKFAAGHLTRQSETFVALNGDIICRFSLRDMVAFHRRLAASATIALAPYRSSWGVVELDGDLITAFVQSPELPYWINAGVYVLGAETVERLPERGDHEDTTFPELAAAGRLAGFRVEGTRRQAHFHDGEYHDVHIMAILRDEAQAL